MEQNNSLKEQLTKQEQNRMPIILDYLMLNLSHDQIAKELGLNRATIERDLNSWVNTEQFNTWSKTDWLRLHFLMQSKDPETRNRYRDVYRALTLLIKRGGIDINVTHTNITDIKVVFDSDDKKPVIDV